jgi:hypothetical protein
MHFIVLTIFSNKMDRTMKNFCSKYNKKWIVNLKIKFYKNLKDFKWWWNALYGILKLELNNNKIQTAF